jgi:YidC/Oxa1 family membrane protein insertase
VANKHLVFYSEKSGFYKYFEKIINELIRRSNVIIHYVTSDPNDQIFDIAKNQPRIKPYYIGEKRLITLMMKMDADIVVMTMSDLNNFHYKRSYVKKDIEYIYVFHYPLSTHMVLAKGALDHYDTIFCIGEFQFEEIRETERLYNLPEKNLIAVGYGQLEKLYESYCKMEHIDRKIKKVLIAPSWQPDNILDSCIDELLAALLGKGFEIVVRPHPEYVKRYGFRMDAIVNRYSDYKGSDLSFELDFTSNNSIFDSDVVITDWSGTAYEFSFVTKKPSIFINTPPKINNREYDRLSIKPLEITLRDKIGIQVKPDNLANITDKIHELLNSAEKYADEITAIVDKYIANFGSSGVIGSKYIINRLKEVGKKR